MAAQNTDSFLPVDDPCMVELRKILWGRELKEDVFRRWAQGFVLSNEEPTALIQYEGGPCAIISPVQAYLVKNILLKRRGEITSWRQISQECCKRILINTLCEILHQCSGEGYVVVMTTGGLGDHSPGPPVTEGPGVNQDDPTTAKKRKLGHQYFHSHLRLHRLQNLPEVQALFEDHYDILRDNFGVLLFLYSLALTKGLSQLKEEMSDPNEPLIDSTHGHGSQSLINLLLVGYATANVFDGEQEVDGLKLYGVVQQSEVGYLTILERLRYCEVGHFLKNPQNPVWVLSSETHLTVLFSTEFALVSPETPDETARRVFKSFDPEGNNFISTVVLEAVMQALNLVTDPEYITLMKQKLDSEGLGIILLSAFLEEFFPEDKRSTPDSFILYHYNGLQNSSAGGKVKYHEGNAVLLESEVRCIADNNPMLTCLQTKWPNIEVQWSSDVPPCLN